MANKPRVGIFDFTGCEGCELNQLNFEDQLLDILAHVDIVEWREAMDGRVDEYDIAFVEGSLSTPDCIKRIHEIRRKTKILVALGACAVQVENLEDKTLKTDALELFEYLNRLGSENGIGRLVFTHKMKYP